MILALATLVLAGLSSAQGQAEATRRQRQLHGRLGVPLPQHLLADTRSQMQKKWDWISTHRPWAVPWLENAYRVEDFERPRPWTLASAQVLDWLSKVVEAPTEDMSLEADANENLGVYFESSVTHAVSDWQDELRRGLAVDPDDIRKRLEMDLDRAYNAAETYRRENPDEDLPHLRSAWAQHRGTGFAEAELEVMRLPVQLGLGTQHRLVVTVQIYADQRERQGVPRGRLFREVIYIPSRGEGGLHDVAPGAFWIRDTVYQGQLQRDTLDRNRPALCFKEVLLPVWRPTFLDQLEEDYEVEDHGELGLLIRKADAEDLWTDTEDEDLGDAMLAILERYVINRPNPRLLFYIRQKIEEYVLVNGPEALDHRSGKPKSLGHAFGDAMQAERDMMLDQEVQSVTSDLGLITADTDLTEEDQVVRRGWPDGARYLEFFTTRALVVEGLKATNCVGLEKHGHPALLRQGEVRIFGYRTPDDKSRATLEVRSSPPYATVELFGPHNGPIHDTLARKRTETFLRQLRGPGNVLSLADIKMVRPDEHKEFVRRHHQGNVGRQYGDNEWLEFLIEDEEHPFLEGLPEPLRQLQTAFEERIDGLMDNYREELEIPDDAEVWNTAYLTFATLEGHGVGLHDVDEPWHEDFWDLVQHDPELLRIQTEIEHNH